MTRVERGPQAERHACGQATGLAAIGADEAARTIFRDRQDTLRQILPGSALCADLPTLPVEEEGRLHDPVIREHFIERIYAFRRVRRLLEDHAGVGDLVQFHSQHKLQLLAHAPAQYTALGRLVSHARATPPERLRADYEGGFRAALTTIVTRGRHVNVLQHAAGYFRRVLSAAACRDVAAAIIDYERRLTPLVVPLRLIEHYARLHDVRYLCNQTYLNPYPRELMFGHHTLLHVQPPH